jgi:hypothetical protein
MRTSYLVCYDICDDKRLRKVFQIMRGYGLTPSYLIIVVWHVSGQNENRPVGPARCPPIWPTRRPSPTEYRKHPPAFDGGAKHNRT